LKSIVIRCRAILQEGLVRLSEALYEEDFEEAKIFFKEAEKAYNTFDYSAQNAPVQEDVNLLKGLQLYSNLCFEFSRLQHEEDDDYQKTRQRLHKLTVRISRARHWLEMNRSLTLVIKINEIAIQIEETINNITEKKFSEVFSNLDYICQELCKFSGVMPAQECPTAQKVVADLNIQVPGKKTKGVGKTPDVPVVFTNTHDLVFDVRVHLETQQLKGTLFVSFTSGATFNECIVPIIDKPWPVIFNAGNVSPSYAAVPYRFELRLKTYGGITTLVEKTIWVKVIDRNSLIVPEYIDLRSDNKEVISPKHIKVAVAQCFEVEDIDNEQDYYHTYYQKEILSKGLLIFRECKKEYVISQIFSMLKEAADKNCDLIVFPEFSLPVDAKNLVEEFSKNKDIVIVIGLEHQRSDSGYYKNEILAFYPNGSIIPIKKQSESFFQIDNKQVLEFVDNNNDQQIITTIATDTLSKVIICKQDLLDNNNSVMIHRMLENEFDNDLIITPSFTQFYQDYYSSAISNMSRILKVFIFSNHSIFGNSVILTPLKDKLDNIKKDKLLLAKNENLDQMTDILAPGKTGILIEAIPIFDIKKYRTGELQSDLFITKMYS